MGVATFCSLDRPSHSTHHRIRTHEYQVSNVLYFVQNDSERCLEALKDIQRLLRRDNPRHRVLFRSLGDWNIVQRKIVPMIILNPERKRLLYESVRLLTRLTMPIDPEAEIDEVFRDFDILKKYVETITLYEGRSVAAIVGMLEEPLARAHNSPAGFSEKDEELLELVLTLFGNLLNVSNDKEKGGSAGAHMSRIHERLLQCFEKELVLDTIVAVVDLIGSGDYAIEYHMLILDVIHLIFRGYDPKDVVDGGVDSSKLRGRTSAKTNSDSFKALMARDATRRNLLRASSKFGRHPRFGGSLQIKSVDTKLGTITASAPSYFKDTSQTVKGKQPPRRRPSSALRRQREESIMSARILGINDDGRTIRIPRAVALTLRKFCGAIMESGGYAALLRWIQVATKQQNHGKVYDADKLKMLHVVWFCTRFRRLGAAKDERRKVSEPRSVVIEGGLTKWLIGWVIQCCQLYDPLSKEVDHSWGSLGLSVALLSELLAVLYCMMTSADQATKSMGENLRGLIFYTNDLIFVLQQLLTRWDERKVGLPHMMHLVFATHTLLKCAETVSDDAVVLSRRRKQRRKRKKKRRKKKKAEEETKGSVENDDVSSETKDVSEHRNVEESEVGTEDASKEPAARLADTTEQMTGDIDAVAPISGEKTSGDAGTTNNPTKISTHEKSDANDSEDSDSSSEEEDNPEEAVVVRHEKYWDLGKFQHDFMTAKVLRNYCALLAHYVTNGAKTNHYIVSFLSRLHGMKKGGREHGESMEMILWSEDALGLFNKIMRDPLTSKSRRAHEFRHMRAFVVTTLQRYRLRKENGLVPSSDSNARKDENDDDYEDENEEEWIERAMSMAKKNASMEVKQVDEEENPESSSDDEEMDLSDFDDGSDSGKAGDAHGDDDPTEGEVKDPWTDAEDAAIRAQWDDVKDLDSRCQIIALSDALQIKQRTVAQVEARLADLGLTTRKRRTQKTSIDTKLRRTVVRDALRKLRDDMGKSESKTFDAMTEWVAGLASDYLKRWRSHLRPRSRRRRRQRRKKKVDSRSAFDFFCEDRRAIVLESNAERFDSLTEDAKSSVTVPEGPKRPLSAYNFFCAKTREDLKRDNSDMSPTETMKRLGELWTNIDAESKAHFESKAADDKERYATEKAKYLADNKDVLEMMDRIKSQEAELFKFLESEWSKLDESDRRPFVERASETDEVSVEEGVKTRASSSLSSSAEKADGASKIGNGDDVVDENESHPDFPELPSLRRIEREARTLFNGDVDLTMGMKDIRKKLESAFDLDRKALKPLKAELKQIVEKIFTESAAQEEEEPATKDGEESDYEALEDSHTQVEPTGTLSSLLISGRTDAQNIWLSRRRTQLLLRAMLFEQKKMDTKEGETVGFAWTFSPENRDPNVFADIVRTFKATLRTEKKKKKKAIRSTAVKRRSPSATEAPSPASPAKRLRRLKKRMTEIDSDNSDEDEEEEEDLFGKEAAEDVNSGALRDVTNAEETSAASGTFEQTNASERPRKRVRRVVMDSSDEEDE